MENTKRLDEIVQVCAVTLFIIVSTVQISVSIRAMIGAVLTLLLYFLMKRYMPRLEWLVGFLLVVTTISFLNIIVVNAITFLDVLPVGTIRSAFSAILIYVLCAGGLLYVAKRCNTDRMFVDAVVWGLALSPYAALVDDCYDKCSGGYDRSHTCLIILLGCFAVLYFFAHRNKWGDLPVKLMFMLRIMIFIAIGTLIDLIFDIDDPDYPRCYVLVALLVFSLYQVFVYRNSSYRLIKNFSVGEFLHKFGNDTLIIVVVWVMLPFVVDLFSYIGFHLRQNLRAVLWSVYPLMLIFIGLKKDIAYIRIEGSILFFLFSLTIIDKFDVSDPLSRIILWILTATCLFVVALMYKRIYRRVGRK
ncbi:MAG: hypothetical protein IK005_05225 [Paludibacteraceae bacterium]|nr:hypothetical protein [Paludibacteraceae bacterium]